MPWWCDRHKQHSIDELCPVCEDEARKRSPAHALEIVEEEFDALCKDFPYLTKRVPYRQLDSTLVWDLIERIKERIALLGVETPDPPGCDPRFGCADGKCYRHGNN